METLGSLVLCWREYKRCSYCGKWFGDSSKTDTYNYHTNPAIPLLGIHTKELKAGIKMPDTLYTHVPSSVIHSSQNVEADQGPVIR